MRTNNWFVLKVEPCRAVLSHAEQGRPLPPLVDGGSRQGARPICDVIPEVPQQTGRNNGNPWSGAGEGAEVRWWFIVDGVCGKAGYWRVGQPCLLLGFTLYNESAWQICAKVGPKVIQILKGWKHCKQTSTHPDIAQCIFHDIYCVFLSGIDWFLVTKEKKTIKISWPTLRPNTL